MGWAGLGHYPALLHEGDRTGNGDYLHSLFFEFQLPASSTGTPVLVSTSSPNSAVSCESPRQLELVKGKNRDSGEQSCGLGAGMSVSSCPPSSIPVAAAVGLSSALSICDTEWLISGERVSFLAGHRQVGGFLKTTL